MLHVLQAFAGPGRTVLSLRPDVLDVSRVRPGHPQRLAHLPAPRRLHHRPGRRGGGRRRAPARRRAARPAPTTRPARRSTWTPSPRSPMRRPASWWSTRPTTSSPGPARRARWSCCRDYPRLAVSRTMSKAFAFAGGRLGYLAASAGLRRRAADRPAALPPVRGHPGRRPGRAGQRRRAAGRRRPAARRAGRPGGLAGRPRVCEVADSDANFVLFGRFADRHAVWQALLDRGVLIREVGPDGWLRVSAGTPSEMAGVQGRARPRCWDARSPMSEPNRTATVERTTSESSVTREPRPGRHRPVRRSPPASASTTTC